MDHLTKQYMENILKVLQVLEIRQQAIIKELDVDLEKFVEELKEAEENEPKKRIK